MNESPAHYTAVAAGSALGGLARYLLSVSGQAWLGDAFPWPTLIANLAGSFLIGLYFALNLPGGKLSDPPARRVFVMAGFCGGFTTFSLFSLESMMLLEAGRIAALFAYLVLSLSGWLAAVWLGYRVGRRPGSAGA